MWKNITITSGLPLEALPKAPTSIIIVVTFINSNELNIYGYVHFDAILVLMSENISLNATFYFARRGDYVKKGHGGGTEAKKAFNEI